LTAVTGKVIDVAERVMEVDTATPVPVSATVCGEPVALSAKLSEALSAPAAVGLKVTETVQDPPAARFPQLLVWVNEEGLEPPVIMLVRVSAAFPVFLSVTVCAADEEPSLVEGNVRLVGDKLTAGAPTPVPVSVTLSAEDAAVAAAMLSAPVAVPTAVGSKVTEKVHEELAASDEPQVFVWA
jgi:hypothetical protein